MRKILPILIIGLLQSTVSYSQTASVAWPLTVDTSVVTSGNITAVTQKLFGLSAFYEIPPSIDGVPNTSISVQKDRPDSTTSGTSTGYWPAETGYNSARYTQFAISPKAGTNFTATSLSLYLGAKAVSTICAAIYYSMDSTFATKTPIAEYDNMSSNAVVTKTISFSVTVVSGQTFYVRVYPWTTVATTANSKYLYIGNVTIAGTSASAGSSSITLSPSTLSFGTISVLWTKDKLFALSGLSLNPTSDSIRITAPAGFKVSTTLGSGYSSYLALPYSGSTLGLDTVYVRFVPSTAKTYSDTVFVSGGGAARQSILVSGTAVDASVILGIFVSTTGSDADSGTYTHPYLTLQKAISVATPGDSIFVRAGRYVNNSTINITSSGTANKMIALYAYPPDNSRPFLDFSFMAYSGSNRGLYLTGSYWHIKGLDIYKAGDNGMFTAGSNNIIEFCVFHENRDGGCQLGGGASYNQIKNCDSYFNYDSVTAGGNADGFSPKMDVGTGNYFYGCRSWMNSDDGWDGYLRGANNVTTTLDSCWTWRNGYLKNGTDPGSQANGNGFKMGGSDTKDLAHNFILKNCLSFNNKAKGFDQNSNAGSITLYNCTAYKNTGQDYMLNSSGVSYSASSVFMIINCLTLGTSGTSFRASSILTTNNFSTSAGDYVSIDTTGISGPRKADGSLPDINFMHLARGSQFIDVGTNVGLPFNGSAPDLGCFESNYPTSVANENDIKIDGFQLLQNYPNPFNPSTTIIYQVAKVGLVTLTIYDLLGRDIVTLVNEVKPAGKYTAVWNASKMPSGMYFGQLKSNGEQQIRKMILLK
ncbi:MAG: T9SS type A sorting domain-containing protein [Bacteroidota bacterium]